MPNVHGTVAKAQLTFGGGMLMLKSALKGETEFGCLMKQPDKFGGAATQTTNVVVTDADTVYAKAQAGGAKTATAIRDEDCGGRDFGQGVIAATHTTHRLTCARVTAVRAPGINSTRTPCPHSCKP